MQVGRAETSDAARVLELWDRFGVGWDGWRCHLYRLVVDPDFRRLGCARALAAAALARARALGAARLDASVDPDNEPAVRFWEGIRYTVDHDQRWSVTVGSH